jgi:flagellar basal-body rod modification protein FlgD
VDGISAATLSPSATAATSRSAADLTSDDFFKLLITQLQQQDPLEPMDNTEMLKQIASVREIELSSTLTESLRSLTGQQQFASASSLLGQFVASHPDESGYSVRGIVEGVRFDGNGSPVLQLANGSEIPLNDVASIKPALSVAESMIGQIVTGVDRRDAVRPRIAEGLVTAARMDDAGEVLLELDTGEMLRLKDVLSARAAEA